MPIGDLTDIGRAVLDSWARILPVASTDPDADFFDRGGQSLQLVWFLQEVYDRYGVDLPTAELFLDAFTARRAAQAIERAIAERADVDDLADRLAELPEGQALDLLAETRVQQ